MIKKIIEFDNIYAIMEESFPEDERRPYKEQKALLSDERYSIYGTAGGFIAAWEFDEFIFIEHFAVKKDMRNSGLGSRLLSEFISKQKKPVCLEVEPPDTKIAKRRIGFYERNGFFLNDYAYFQPPISAGKRTVPLMIMTSGSCVEKDKFDNIRKTLYREIYKYEGEIKMKESIWNNFKRLDFEFEGREAILIIPETANDKKNWLFKTEYFDAFPGFEIEMVKRGWHIAYIKNTTRWCLDSDLDLKKRFAEFLKKEFGLYEKCVPVGMSCGGLIGSKFTAKYPECVSALYLDAPVMNFLSCPAGVGDAGSDMMEEFTKATGMTLCDLLSYRENPIDKMHIILENKIPVIMVYGDSDKVVPYHENGAVFEKFYRENGGVIESYGKEGCGHHPHGLEDNTPIIEFVEKYSR